MTKFTFAFKALIWGWLQPERVTMLVLVLCFFQYHLPLLVKLQHKLLQASSNHFIVLELLVFFVVAMVLEVVAVVTMGSNDTTDVSNAFLSMRKPSLMYVLLSSLSLMLLLLLILLLLPLLLLLPQLLPFWGWLSSPPLLCH